MQCFIGLQLFNVSRFTENILGILREWETHLCLILSSSFKRRVVQYLSDDGLPNMDPKVEVLFSETLKNMRKIDRIGLKRGHTWSFEVTEPKSGIRFLEFTKADPIRRMF